MNPDLTAADHVIHVGKIDIRYLLDGQADGQADGRMGMFEMTVQPQSNVPPPHSHPESDEMVYVLEGTLRYSVNGDARDLHAGDSMFSPRGSDHAFSNPHDKPVRVLTVLSPDIGAQYFRDVLLPYTRCQPAAIILDSYRAHFTPRVVEAAAAMQLIRGRTVDAIKMYHSPLSAHECHSLIK